MEPPTVDVREVGLRDGLQSIHSTLSLEQKQEWIVRAHAAGLRELEVGSFVPARLLPQMADTAALVAFAKTLPGLRVTVLVPNLKGAERALEGAPDILVFPLSASRAHSVANLRRTTDEAIAELGRIRAARDSAGAATLIEAGISTAFGCTLQGEVPVQDVMHCVQGALDIGVDGVGLADTVGHADPAAVRRLFAETARRAGDRLWSAHFHDTRGLGLANVLAALDEGVRRFDASLGGLGGCPHAPGASGNVAVEDLVFMLERMGLPTGVDLHRLLALRARLVSWLPNEATHGSVWRAGPLPAKQPAMEAETAAVAAPMPTPPQDAPALPLAGVRVVEFSHMVMGPSCGMILADLGAEVIKVEPPGGDPTRRLSGLGVGFFRTFNRNKKSVVLDVEDPADRATTRALIASADVVIENFRPGRMARLGLDHASLRTEFPRLVYVSLKGFLPGPYEHRLALDEVVQMMGGLAYMTGPEGRPLRAGSSVNDIMGGMFGAIGALAALRERDITGRGQEVQSGLFENCVLLAAQHMQQSAMTGQPATPMPSRVSPWGIYDVFTVADAQQLFVAAINDKHWQTLCQVLEAPDLAADPELATNAQRAAARATLLPRLGERMRHWPLDVLAARLEAASLPFAPIRRPDQLLDDPHMRASGGLVPMQADDGSMTDTVLLPITLDGRRLGVRHPLPTPGEHTAQLLPQPQPG